jgi:tRNA wybutosine-synthesizing protein 4
MTSIQTAFLKCPLAVEGEGNQPPLRQIVSLGAGFDTTVFHIANSKGLMQAGAQVSYFEIDLPQVVEYKRRTIHATPELSCLVGKVLGPSNGGENDGPTFASKNPGSSTPIIRNYKILDCDLCDTAKTMQSLCSVGFDPAVPTLFISEVALSYVPTASVDDLIAMFGAECPTSIFALYEQCHPDDAFGALMCNYFEDAGSPLCSISSYPSPPDQVRRFQERGWGTAKAVTVSDFFRNFESARHAERQPNSHSPSCLVALCENIKDLEPFDEYEEFDLAKHHYFVLCAANDRSNTGLRHLIDGETGTLDILLSEGSVPSDREQYHEAEEAARFGSNQAATSANAGRGDISTSVITPSGRWAHSLSVVPCGGNHGAKDVYVFGGYGGDKHRRLDELLRLRVRPQESDLFTNCIESIAAADVTTLSSANMSWDNIQPPVSATVENEAPLPTPRMHHTLTRMKDNRLLLFGGRSSPLRPCTDCMVCDVDKGGVWSTWKLPGGCTDTADMPKPRWRHSASCLAAGQTVFIFGGTRTQQVADAPSPRFECDVLNDVHIFDAASNDWMELDGANLERGAPSPRHSHSCTPWEGISGHVIFGGRGPKGEVLGGAFYVLREPVMGQFCTSKSVGTPVSEISGEASDQNPQQQQEQRESWAWSSLDVVPPVRGRYSHDASFLGPHELLVVGGVFDGVQDWYRDSFVVVNLQTQTASSLVVDTGLRHRLLLHSHKIVTVQCEGQNSVVVVGGGGSCFAFRSHANPIGENIVLGMWPHGE